MNRIPAILAACLVLLAGLFGSRSALADAHTESIAKEALQKAASDYLAMNYTAAVARLTKAVHACGAKNCTPPTKATILRDLGTMQFRAGDKNGAAKSWAEALALEPTLTLNADYDSSDVGAAWEDARAIAGLPAGQVSTKPPPSAAGAGAGAVAAPSPGGTPAPAKGTVGAAAAGAAPPPAAPPAPPEEPIGEQPSGDFSHDPAFEQREDTPLPIHVEYAGSSRVARVVVKYKSAQMREWARVELKKAGESAWEGTIPCADVGRGTMRYWVQGFDRTGEPLIATGDPKHPYYVPIREKITSEPPHLPGKEAPKSCEETDCPPGLAGCKRKRVAGAEGTAGEGEGAAKGEGEGGGTEEGEEDKKGKAAFRRIWVGLSFALDLVSFSDATDVCRRNPNGAALNSQGYYCYDPGAGAEFPSSPALNGLLQSGGAGTAKGGILPGNVRILLSFDYALTANFLAGVRAGYVFGTFPGSTAAHFAPVHLEARGTYLLGNAPLSHEGIAPMGFVGLGLSEFDGHQSTCVSYMGSTKAVGCPQPPPTAPRLPNQVDVYLTDAPFFVALGLGVRYQFGRRVALLGALKLDLAIGGNGLLPTFGPELGGMFAF
jgi:hypothetical protein